MRAEYMAGLPALRIRGRFRLFPHASRYTLLEQTALETFLPLCQERNISIIIGGPFNTGILATGAIEGAFYDYDSAQQRDAGQ